MRDIFMKSTAFRMSSTAEQHFGGAVSRDDTGQRHSPGRGQQVETGDEGSRRCAHCSNAAADRQAHHRPQDSGGWT